MEHGLFREVFEPSPEARAIMGRDNPIQGQPTWRGYANQSHAGQYWYVEVNPDGRLSGWNSAKVLADVQDGKLYISTSRMGVPLDNQGFPSDFEPNGYFIR